MKDDCSNCGMCCVKTGFPPFTEEEFKKLPIDLQDKLNRYAKSQRARENVKGVCPLYDVLNDRCTEYLLRPERCDTGFPLNGPECQRLVQVVIIGDRIRKELDGCRSRSN